MSDQLVPIFPPSLPNISFNTLQLSERLLPQETLDTLQVDRARQTATSAAAAVMLCQELGLSEEIVSTFARAVAERGAELSVEYQAYFARLLGTGALVLATQEGSHADRTPQRPQIDREANGAGYDAVVVAATDAPEDKDEITLSGFDADAQDASVIEGSATPIPAPESRFPEDLVLFGHERAPTAQRSFVARSLFGDGARIATVQHLTHQEIAATSWLLLNEAGKLKFRRMGPAAVHAQLAFIAKLVGMDGPAINRTELCNREGITPAASTQRVTKMCARLFDTFGKDAQRIMQEARQAVVDGRVTFSDQITGDDETAKTEPPHPSPVTQETATEEAPRQDEEEALAIHDEIPPSMREFLESVFPPTSRAKLDVLTPAQASLLVNGILQRYRSLTSTGLRSDQQEERAQLMERFTGLRGQPETYEMIAVTGDHTELELRTIVMNVTHKIGREILPPELMQMLLNVRSLPTTPRRSA